MSTDAIRRLRVLRWRSSWTMVVAALALVPVIPVAATVAAEYMTEADAVTQVVRKARADDVIQRTLDVAQLLGDAVGYLDVLRRSGWR